MNLKEVNTWWKKSIDKERARNTNAPKAPKGEKFATMTNFSDFAPELKTEEQLRARRHR